MKAIYISGLTILLVACTNSGVYEQVFLNQRNECIKSATTLQQIEHCDTEYSRRMKFEEYEQQRKVVTESK
ncbi:MAG: hypothetical protein HWE10_00585 [Gammaproteobacteria bacterium]|nr:hypothetical protein [Gammaproteobacteria bacterium]